MKTLTYRFTRPVDRVPRLVQASLFWVISIGFVPSSYAEEVFRVVNVTQGDTLNIRTTPSNNSTIAGRIPGGTAGIVRAGECKTWCRVRYNDIEGWVDKRFLAPDESPPEKVAGQTSSDPVSDCNSDYSAKKISGCTALIERKPPLPPEQLSIARSRRADAYFAAGKLDAAIADRAKVLEIEPSNRDHVRRLSELYRLRAESGIPGQRTLSDLNEAIRIDASNDAAFAGRGIMRARALELDAAIADLLEARKLQPDEVLHKLVLARVYEQRGLQSAIRGDWDKAVSDYTEALALDAEDISIINHRGDVFAAKDQIAAAKEDYSAAIRLQPGNIEARIRRAELYHSEQNYAGAVGDLNEVISKQPNDLGALMLRGLALEWSGRNDDAVTDFRAVLKINPEHELARASLDRLGLGIPKPFDVILSDPKGDAKVAPPGRVPPDLANLDTKQRTTLLQQELERVGCNPGEADGEWGPATENALDEFAKHAKITLSSDEPFETALAAIWKHTRRVCPCGDNETERDGQCVPNPETAAAPGKMPSQSGEATPGQCGKYHYYKDGECHDARVKRGRRLR